MSDNTPRLRIPELASMQEANCVTWNEALMQLDAFVDLYLLGQYTNTAPASPADGDAYLIGGAPTGAWSGYAYKIASCIDGAWRFYTPFNGLRAYVATTGAFIVYLNGTWTDWNSLLSANEVSVASAATCDLGAAASLFVQITGTTAISSFGSGTNKLRFVRFAQALTLTHNATSLILLGGASRSTAAGDVAIYSSDAGGNWRERSYFTAAGTLGGDYATKTGTETLTNKSLGATNFPYGKIDASGNVGIGTTNPTQKLEVNGAAILGAGTQSNMPPGQALLTGSVVGGDMSGMVLYNAGGGANASVSLDFYNTTGHSNIPQAKIKALDDGNYSDHLTFWTKIPGGPGNAVSERMRIRSDGIVVPGADNTQSFGSSSLRWSVIYAGTGTINTSDAATKSGVRELSEAEIAVAKTLASRARIFQFRDAVAAKDSERARLHCGMIYGDVVSAFVGAGLDPERYGIVCRDPAMKTVTKTRTVRRDNAGVEETYDETVPDLDETGAQKWTFALRYDELAQFIAAGMNAIVQEQSATMATLAMRVAALEAK